MLLGRYLKYLAVFSTTLLVSERVPLIKTIGPGSSEASQLLSALSEFANGVKESVVEIVTRPLDFFHGNENNQTPITHEHSPLLPPIPPSPPSPPPPVLPPVEHPPEPPPEPPQSPEPLQSPEPIQSPEPLQSPEPIQSPGPLQSPEPAAMEDHTSRLLRVEGSRVILELDLETVPGFDTTRRVVAWGAYWLGALFSGGFGADWAGQSYWLHILVPAAIGFFGGLGYGLVGWCRWCLSRREAPPAVEKVAIPKKTKRSAPENEYFESLLSLSFMMPSTLQHARDPRRLKVSPQIAPTESEHAEDVSATLDRIAKKEEDADPLMVPPLLSDSSWYSPGSPTSPTQLDEKRLDFSLYDGFQPKPKVSHQDDLPDTLLGSFPSVTSPPRPRKPSLPNISDPWNNYTPDDRVELS